MRYVTVVPTDDTRLTTEAVYVSSEDEADSYVNNLLGNILTTVIVAVADEVTDELYLGTIASVLLDIPEEQECIELEPGTIVLHALTDWTVEYIQVWDSQEEEWCAAQSSDKTYTEVNGSGYMRDPETGKPIYASDKKTSFYTYSYYYFDTEERKEMAAKYYEKYSIALDLQDYVDIYLRNEDDELTSEPQETRIFRMQRTIALVLPE